MSFIVTIVHVSVSLFLMLTVLLQAGKGGGMGATFGGGSSQGSVFGGSGAGNFLSKLTTASAALFMITSMTLAFLASTTGEDSLKKFSAQQRGHAADKMRLDREAARLNEDTQPDGGLLDELAPERSELDEVDGAGDASATEAGDDEAAVDGAEAAAAEPESAAPAKPKPAVEKPATKVPAPAAEPKPTEPKPAEPKPAGEE